MIEGAPKGWLRSPAEDDTGNHQASICADGGWGSSRGRPEAELTHLQRTMPATTKRADLRWGVWWVRGAGYQEGIGKCRWGEGEKGGGGGAGGAQRLASITCRG